MEKIIELDKKIENCIFLGLYELAAWYRNELDYQRKELYD